MEWIGHIKIKHHGTVKVLFSETTPGVKVTLRKLGKKGTYFEDVSKYCNGNLRDFKWLMQGHPLLF